MSLPIISVATVNKPAPVMRTFVELNKSDVHLTLYSFPLDGGCNPGIPKAYDGKRCRLAKSSILRRKTKARLVDA